MVAPTGEQYEITGGGYRAVVTECGGGLRLLEHEGRPLLDGYEEHEVCPHGRGQLLVPWPNRIEDGSYAFDGVEHQLPLSEPGRRNAIHGLARWTSWALEEQTDATVSLVCRLMAQKGYPWSLDLHVLYDLSADGLTVTVTATNLSEEAAPYAVGAHPYLTVGSADADDRVDGWELTIPAETRVTGDDRMLPTGRESVSGTPYDFRVTRPIRSTVFDDAFTDLSRDEDGRAEVVLRNPSDGRATVLWMDTVHEWIQVFTGDSLGPAARRSIAIEPMTAGANAFRSGESLARLEPAGGDKDEHSCSWGVRSG